MDFVFNLIAALASNTNGLLDSFADVVEALIGAFDAVAEVSSKPDVAPEPTTSIPATPLEPATPIVPED